MIGTKVALMVAFGAATLCGGCLPAYGVHLGPNISNVGHTIQPHAEIGVGVFNFAWIDSPFQSLLLNSSFYGGGNGSNILAFGIKAKSLSIEENQPVLVYHFGLEGGPSLVRDGDNGRYFGTKLGVEYPIGLERDDFTDPRADPGIPWSIGIDAQAGSLKVGSSHRWRFGLSLLIGIAIP